MDTTEYVLLQPYNRARAPVLGVVEQSVLRTEYVRRTIASAGPDLLWLYADAPTPMTTNLRYVYINDTKVAVCARIQLRYRALRTETTNRQSVSVADQVNRHE